MNGPSFHVLTALLAVHTLTTPARKLLPASGALSMIRRPQNIQTNTLKAPPPTRQDNVREVLHGVEIIDPYRWLEEDDSPETRAWIDAQNAHTDALLGSLPARERIEKRLTELMKIDVLGGPIERNGSYFFFKRRRDQDLSVLYRRKGLKGKDEVLIDPHPMSADHTTSVGLADVSRDGTLLAYSIRRGGEDEVEIRLMDVETRRDLPDRLPRALYFGPSLKKDKSGFYYSLRDRGKGTRVYYHAMGTDPAQDKEIFGQGYGPDKWVSAGVSEDGRYLLLTVGHGWTKTEVYVQDIAGNGPIRPIVTDIDAKFSPWFAGDRLVMQTDWEASNRRILSVDLNDPAREKWREIVPAGADAIQGFSLVGGKLFVHYLHNVATQIKIFDLEGHPLGKIALPGLGAAGAPNGRWDSNEGFFSFSSYTTPRVTYRYDVAIGRKTVWARDKVPVQSGQFVVRQVWYESRDGTKVPMFLIHKKGLRPDGKRPTLLYGYGGFNVSLTPWFSPIATLWAEQGGVYAVANLRGGGEFGEAWHRAGMLDKKQNVFDDFIAAAEWLIRNKYTNPAKLAIQGGSNGGLLVGAALTQRPDLFRAVLCQFPDLDMVRYYQFTRNNNPPAVREYGNGGDPEQFKFLYAYSPYQRVKPQTIYPAVLFTTGDTDTRVPPHQARKMAALLQSATASNRPILLHYDTRAGHAGGKPFRKVIEDLALENAFLFWQLGVDPR
jgi:prolyl oligopeptidase